MSDSDNFDEYEVGQTDSISKTVTETDLVLFAAVTGDFNPIHVDEEYAKKTMFKGRIAHGVISAGIISAVLAMKLPGPGSIIMEKNIKFKAPVRIGDTVTATVTITEIIKEKRIIKLHTVCTVAGKEVNTGDCTMMKP
ncbi:MAG: (R)-hydratase [Gammaproteobacteria bacterium]|nr:MAG: (R)-hydratase [Gammaproteobacteria bacterium]